MIFVQWCNENNGFLTAILSVIGLLLSIIAIVVSIHTARLPYKKQLLLGSSLLLGASVNLGISAKTFIMGLSASATNIGNRTINHVSCFDDTLQNGYTYWTEFYASYSTFDIFEDIGLYASFKAIFERKDASEGKKKYFTARVFGYYLHENHPARCDNLIKRYLSKDDIEKATESFKSVMNSYPAYTDYQLRNIGIEMSKVINKPKEKMILTPMPAGRLWQRKR